MALTVMQGVKRVASGTSKQSGTGVHDRAYCRNPSCGYITLTEPYSDVMVAVSPLC